LTFPFKTPLRLRSLVYSAPLPWSSTGNPVPVHPFQHQQKAFPEPLLQPTTSGLPVANHPLTRPVKIYRGDAISCYLGFFNSFQW
jgi:hypothetical protein